MKKKVYLVDVERDFVSLQICTQLDERSEKFQADLQKEVAEIKV